MSATTVSLDRQEVEHGFVFCPLADRSVPVERCFHCGRLIDYDRAMAPRYIVCDARMVTGWLGLDEID